MFWFWYKRTPDRLDNMLNCFDAVSSMYHLSQISESNQIYNSPHFEFYITLIGLVVEAWLYFDWTKVKTGETHL